MHRFLVLIARAWEGEKKKGRVGTLPTASPYNVISENLSTGKKLRGSSARLPDYC